MKICLYTTEYPPDTGGVGNYYYGLIQALQTEQQKVNVVHRPGRWYHFLIHILLHPAGIVWVGQILPIGTAAWIAHLLTGRPYFVSLHGMDINLAKQNKPWLTRRILQRAKFITVNSNYTRSQLDDLNLNHPNIVIVYPAPHIQTHVDKVYQAQLMRRLNLQHKHILISVGRIVERKGFQEVIQHIPGLIADYPDLRYIIVGSGEYLPQLKKKIAHMNLESKVYVLTDLNDSQLAAVYDLGDIFVMPTQKLNADIEGFGIVYLEANLFGLPVVATPVGGAVEAVKHGYSGLLVENPYIKSAIEKLINRPEYAAELGQQGKQRVKSKFDYHTQVKSIINALT